MNFPTRECKHCHKPYDWRGSSATDGAEWSFCSHECETKYDVFEDMVPNGQIRQA